MNVIFSLLCFVQYNFQIFLVGLNFLSFHNGELELNKDTLKILESFKSKELVATVGIIGLGRSGKSTLGNTLAEFFIPKNIIKPFPTSHSTQSCTVGIDLMVIPLEERILLIFDVQGLEHGDTTKLDLLYGIICWLCTSVYFVEDGLITYRSVKSIAWLVRAKLSAVSTHIPKGLHPWPSILLIANKASLEYPKQEFLDTWWSKFVNEGIHGTELKAEFSIITSAFSSVQMTAIPFIPDLQNSIKVTEMVKFPLQHLVNEIMGSIPFQRMNWQLLYSDGTNDKKELRPLLIQDLLLFSPIVLSAYTRRESSINDFSDGMDRVIYSICSSKFQSIVDKVSKRLASFREVVDQNIEKDLSSLLKDEIEVIFSDVVQIFFTSVLSELKSGDTSYLHPDTVRKSKVYLYFIAKLTDILKSKEIDFLGEIYDSYSIVSQMIESKTEISDTDVKLVKEIKNGSLFNDDFQNLYELSQIRANFCRLKLFHKNGKVSYTEWVKGKDIAASIGSKSVRWSTKSGFAKGAEITASFVAAAGLTIVTAGTAAPACAAAVAAGIVAAYAASQNDGVYVMTSTPIQGSKQEIIQVERGTERNPASFDRHEDNNKFEVFTMHDNLVNVENSSNLIADKGGNGKLPDSASIPVDINKMPSLETLNLASLKPAPLPPAPYLSASATISTPIVALGADTHGGFYLAKTVVGNQDTENLTGLQFDKEFCLQKTSRPLLPLPDIVRPPINITISDAICSDGKVVTSVVKSLNVETKYGQGSLNLNIPTIAPDYNIPEPPILNQKLN